ncbi:MAG TPA: bifunctional diaminohydroxyphosphoribosylaminopyrimidine deaminase/5-amino-6-(5-phosphoribosylamino)uracil reductase RibD [Vicinamibacterales bacterium]|jgi:diaminohydroxyphosphoribosylaminopyrimidine deaminase/5-amino-6-(5-phosphoribosylamino)uracil reductase|nr:bifunctional diaminohydroxyphosphoribosylaminopyrimidine deaminase/5-amino-6-(5-phosphoribosylamino)uracil reductase RibD [Vicinamibacterales bacterium]
MVTDADVMRRALFHAARAAGVTTPNPMVGAVVVSAGGVIVGQGRHPRAGAPHAEVFALDQAGPLARGGTLYVTLEPCCHYGRTAPCTTRVIASGIARAVVAMTDPNPLVNGKGIAELRAAGIEVDVGVLEEEARRLNRAFVTVQTLGRPEVIVKAASSADGFIAARPGERTPITAAEANRRVQRVRAVVDAIAVGSGTVLADDPLLTVRDSARVRPLVRAVFDRRLRTPPAARLLSTLPDGPVIILTSNRAMTHAADRVSALRAAGATVVPSGDDIAGALRALLAFDVSALLVEGGSVIHRTLFDGGLVDTVHLIVSPQRLGGGVPLFGNGIVGVPEGDLRTVTQLGPDCWMEFDVHRNH